MSPPPCVRWWGRSCGVRLRRIEATAVGLSGSVSQCLLWPNNEEGKSLCRGKKLLELPSILKLLELPLDREGDEKRRA